ncbi:MAG TPA: CBS domain-containing protein [Pirellulales bacterium]|nr:CBS domain-containing protein [Pirellulales bacterium]
MSVGSICQREVDVTDQKTTILAAAQRMRQHARGCLIVIERGQTPVGILTDRDVVVRVVAAGLDPATTTVGEVMTQFPHLASDDMPIENALGLMRRHGFRHLPVVDDGGRLAGLVTLDDVLLLLAEEFSSIGQLLSVVPAAAGPAGAVPASAAEPAGAVPASAGQNFGGRAGLRHRAQPR